MGNIFITCFLALIETALMVQHHLMINTDSYLKKKGLSFSDVTKVNAQIIHGSTFSTLILNKHVRVAQWIARWTSNPEVVGSNPTVDDFFLPFLFQQNYLLFIQNKY